MRPSFYLRIFASALAMCGIASTSSAGETAASLIAAGIQEACASFGALISKNEGDFKSVNQIGCLGFFQLCPLSFPLYFVGTAADFLSNPANQVAAYTKYAKTQWAVASSVGLTDLIGQSVTYQGKTKLIDDSSILMACQFGCGKYGRLWNYAKGGECNASNVKDANGVSVCRYLVDGNNQDVSCFTGRPHALTTAIATQQPSPPSSSPASPGSATTGRAAPASLETLGSCTPTFGKDGPIEIAVGHYVLRFGSAVDTSTVKRLLEVIDTPK